MRIKVLVVDDSGFFRRQISKFLSEDDALEVIATADNGKDAIEKALQFKPDVITMDIEMPVMDGITATREILRHQRVPILMFSTLTTDGAKATLDAMDAGAVDYIPKSFENISRNREEVGRILCEKIREIGRHGITRTSLVNVRETRASKAAILHENINVKNTSHTETKFNNTYQSLYKLLAIGTSTGGPLALQEVLKKLPKNFPLPIILIQHMPGTFTPAFAERLDQMCEITITEAKNGDQLIAGHAYLAPGGKQMTVNKYGKHFKLKVFDGDEAITYKPSVDITFESIADAIPRQVLAVMLTGMGHDGCAGSQKLHDSGAVIWAQDEESSVVWGMPSAVVNAGIVEKILPINEIGDQIVRAV